MFFICFPCLLPERSKGGKMPSIVNRKTGNTLSRAAPYPNASEGMKRSVSSSSLGSMINTEKSDSSIPPPMNNYKQVQCLLSYLFSIFIS